MSQGRRKNRAAWLLGMVVNGVAASCGAVAAARPPDGVACSDWAEAVAIDRHARTLVAGALGDNRILEWDGGHAHFGDLALTRLLPDGRVDAAFGDAGSVIVDVGDFDSLSAVASAREGVIAAGSTSQRAETRSGPKHLVVLHVRDDGTLNDDFADGGVARLDLDGSVRVASLAPTWFGAVYIAGTLEHEQTSEGFIARLRADGELDASFGVGGVVRFGTERENVRFHGVRVLWDGLLIAGHASGDEHVSAIALRLDAHGQPLAHYGDSGLARYELPGSAANDGGAAVSSFGSSVVSLSVTGDDGSARIASVQFDRTGRLTPTVRWLDVPGGSQDSVYAAVLRGRSLLLAGSTGPDDSATSDAYVARLGSSGVLDPTFGGGLQRAHFDLEYASFLGIAVEQGSVTAAGYDFGEEPETLPPSDALVVRYRDDGHLDESFGEGGAVRVDFRNGAHVCGPRIDVGASADAE